MTKLINKLICFEMVETNTQDTQVENVQSLNNNKTMIIGGAVVATSAIVGVVLHQILKDKELVKELVQEGTDTIKIKIQSSTDGNSPTEHEIPQNYCLNNNNKFYKIILQEAIAAKEFKSESDCNNQLQKSLKAHIEIAQLAETIVALTVGDNKSKEKTALENKKSKLEQTYRDILDIMKFELEKNQTDTQDKYQQAINNGKTFAKLLKASITKAKEEAEEAEEAEAKKTKIA